CRRRGPPAGRPAAQSGQGAAGVRRALRSRLRSGARRGAAERRYPSAREEAELVNGEGSLAGRVAVVTGAGSGIGRATAVELGAAGASLVLAGRTEASLRETATLTDAQTRVVAADVSIAADARRVIDEAVAACGTVDVLVNNAGIEGPVASLHEYP